MLRYTFLTALLLCLAACDQAPQTEVASSQQAATPAPVPLTAVAALAEIYGNVNPATATSVWTRPDPNATEPESFDSVEGISTRVELVALSPLGRDRTLVVSAARDAGTGEPARCATCAVILSAFVFERDALGWRVVDRREAIATVAESGLAEAVRLTAQPNGTATMMLAGSGLAVARDGRLQPLASR